MSEHLHHESCPKCGSRDNVGVYSDGHKFCFGCGWYLPAEDSITTIESKLTTTKKEKKADVLPDDFTNEIPKEAYGWLKQYSITPDEITKHNIGWSKSDQMLIFPYYGGEENVILWQGRFFPTRKPKVFTSGYPDAHLLLINCDSGKYPRRVVVVEDPVSAIRVGRYCSSSVLMGSHLSMHKAVGLSRLFTHLTFWLDYDKLDVAIKFLERFKSLFESVDIVVCEKDPKETSDKEIEGYLNGL